MIAVRALNEPGSWDIFLSHTQRNAEGKVLALDFHTTLKAKEAKEPKAKSSWLDVNFCGALTALFVFSPLQSHR